MLLIDDEQAVRWLGQLLDPQGQLDALRLGRPVGLGRDLRKVGHAEDLPVATQPARLSSPILPT